MWIIIRDQVVLVDLCTPTVGDLMIQEVLNKVVVQVVKELDLEEVAVAASHNIYVVEAVVEMVVGMHTCLVPVAGVEVVQKDPLVVVEEVELNVFGMPSFCLSDRCLQFQKNCWQESK